MDINKEREAFEKYIQTVAHPHRSPKVMFFTVNDGHGNVIYCDISIQDQWETWQAAKAQAVPEGFVLVPIKNTKYFSHDGENYEVHDTLAEAKHEAECAIESFRERLADQLCNPPEDGNFQQVGYGVVLAESGYSVDHIVTQDDVDNGEHRYEVGTEIMSLFLIEAQEPAND